MNINVLKGSLVSVLFFSSVLVCQAGNMIIKETPIKAPLSSITGPDGPPWKNPPPFADLTPVEPVEVFDNFYWVGSKSVGIFVINTGEGLMVIDAGWGDRDCRDMVTDIRKLGLNPSDIKLVLISHEHIDHYGCTQYFQDKVSPDAKLAMSRLGWDYLRTRPDEMAFGGPRPTSIDYYLTDGQVVTMGNTSVQIIFTPGHSPGCVSFIIPVTDKGEKHVLGIMGGSSVPRNWENALLYYTSVDYFKEACKVANCDVGLGVHAQRYFADFAKLRTRRPGEPNPLVIGTEKFDTVYLQQYRDSFHKRVKTFPPDVPPPRKAKRK